ncbi:MAG TPA: cytochrome c peroxidase [Steroidobacteraceae bacterium]
MRLLALIAALLLANDAHAASFVLADHCPPSFDLAADGRCSLVSLYQMYTAEPGQGGLRVPLPAMKGRYTPRQIDLGRLLFFDPVLSGDGRTSCAHCHHPDLAYADGRRTGMGVGATGVGPQRRDGAGLLRNTPTLWNVGFLDRLFWDGRASSLETQASGPLFAANEMASTPGHVQQVLAGNAVYRQLFAQAFNRASAQPISINEVTTALAAFESSLISLNSRFDRYAHGDQRALDDSEARGWNVFRGFVGRCSQCHVPPLFSSDDLAVVGAPAVDGVPYDRGAGALAPSNPVLNGAFKVPTLRNIALTAPYFQAGQLATLPAVVDFYNAPRGHAVPTGESVQIHWHVHMRKAELSPQDVTDLLAFLATLTDTSMAPPVPAAVPSGLPVVPRLHP